MKPKAVPWAMREQEGENIGMGIFPIIECVSTQDEPPVPTREAVEREMAALLGKFSATAQVNKAADLESLILADNPPTEAARTKILFTWPKYKTCGQAAREASNALRTPAPTPTPAPAPAASTPAGKRLSGRSKPKPSKPMVRTKEGKYSHRHGLYSARNLDREAEGVVIPETIKHHLVANANASLSYNTWRGVRSVNRRICECKTETKVLLAFLWNNRHLLCFTGWCMARGLRDKTITNYISKVRVKSQSQYNLQLEISLPLTGLFLSNALISQSVGTHSSLLLSICTY